MTLVRLNIQGISYSQTQSGAYALVLSEVDGNRTLPIVIGPFEAQSIVIALEKEIKPPRPLTHDLFKSFADRFNIVIKQVIIHKLSDGVFFSSLICERDKIEEIIDSRTSDAIALATRFNAPIFTYENILDKAGIILKIQDEITFQKVKTTVEDLINDPSSANKLAEETLDQLNSKLNEAIQNEDYELAAKIRDEISKRTS
ncbi:bifunctional nuclease family protein [Lutibacter sp.]|uniref:bifunctional nuclease family protein n=1 Tax=Lutibacter sp. TaxID=1925666 RepID=UPI002733EBF7|nr:bifunctional nuclease family protein [Lutibacter sp.]MDP3312904.1 bifunctional nuclease family protein [Lutibacter sp.]